MSNFSSLRQDVQGAVDSIVPGKVKVGIMFDEEINRHYITGEAELRVRVSYDYDPNMIIPAKVRLKKCQDIHIESINSREQGEAALMFISYYKQRADYMLATDEEVLAFKGHPSQFKADDVVVLGVDKPHGSVKEGIIS